MKVLVTGHTGFKGSWLALMLNYLGHEVFGISLPPQPESMYNQVRLKRFLTSEKFIDILNLPTLKKAIEKLNPEIIIHLAAQPIVSKSFNSPILTFQTNVIGTLNLLKSTDCLDSVQAILIVTTDKVYKINNLNKAYSEGDSLGGMDPYSASKSATDIATQSWRSSFGTKPIAIARAGNVIGGGDFANDRIIPDIVKSIKHKKRLTIRNPSAVRPWQHVLDCLNGYLMLMNAVVNHNVQSEWNFGPSPQDFRSVEELIRQFGLAWKRNIRYKTVKSDFYESQFLVLDSSKSKKLLGWDNKINFENSIQMTVDWYKARNKTEISLNQIQNFFEL